MNEFSRDQRILKHIISYCQQIEEAVSRFGNDSDFGSLRYRIIFPRIPPTWMHGRFKHNSCSCGIFENEFLINLDKLIPAVLCGDNVHTRLLLHPIPYLPG